MTTIKVDDSIQLSPNDAPALTQPRPKWLTTTKVEKLANTWLTSCFSRQFKTKKEEYEYKARAFTLFICVVYPDLKVMRPQILDYLRYCNSRYLNEGPPSVSALKAYKRAVEEMLDKGAQPMIRHKSWGRFKFKAVKPLAFQFLHLCRTLKGDEERIAFNAQGVNSILRFYDIYPTTKKEMDAAVKRFEENILSDTPPSIYPRDNSWQIVDDLKSMLDSSWFKNTQLGKAIAKQQQLGLKPPIGPRLATSSGLVKYRFEDKDEDGKITVETGTLPSIIGAPYEIYKSHELTMHYQDSNGVEEISIFELNKRMAEKICALTKGNGIVPSDYPITDNIRRDTEPGYSFSCSHMRRYVCIESNHKPRIIAKGDWASQSILQPVHDALFNIMRELGADYAHCQDNGFMRLRLLVACSSSYIASKDLSAATDMFPLWFQRLVMEYIFGTDFADCWANVMCRVPFQGGLYYHTGQPMGLYSSWAAFALSHHVLVHLAAWRLGDYSVRRQISVQPWDVYGICGDDVFIRYSSLSDVYSSLMGQCNVKVNNQKSFIAEPGGLRIGEFVKRNAWRGYEISALSPNLITGAFMDYSNAYQLMSKLRGLGYPDKSLNQLVQLLKTGSLKFLNSKASTSRVISLMENIPFELYGMSLQDAGLLDTNLVLSALAGYIQSKVKTVPKVPTPVQSEESMTPFAHRAMIPVPGLATERTPFVEYLAQIKESVTQTAQTSAIQGVVRELYTDSLEYGIPVCSSDIIRAMQRIDHIASLPKVPSYKVAEQRVFLSDFANRMSKIKDTDQAAKAVSKFLNPIVDMRDSSLITINSRDILQSLTRASSN